MVKRLFFIRHGQSVGNVDHAFYSQIPDYAITLTETGKEQAFERGKELAKVEGRFSVFVSSYFRARQTLHQIKKSIGDRIIKEYTPTPLLREQEWSNAVGKHSDMELERERLTWGVYYYRFPGGESCADVSVRLRHFNSVLANELHLGTAENIVIVGHGMAMRIHLAILLSLSVEEFELMRNPKNCGVIELEWGSHEWDWNKGNLGFKLVSGIEYRPNRSHIFEYDPEKVAILGETQPSIHSDWAEEFG